MARSRKSDPRAVLVIGLGRFGVAVAESLVQMGKEVLAVDHDGELVQRWADELTHVVQADSTDDEALHQLGVGDFERAVVAIGADVEASVLTVLALVEAGVPDIWAKAISHKHGKILERVGAHHVVYPEFSMGERVAHILSGSMMDYIEFDDDFCIARTHAPELLWGSRLADSAPRSHHGVTVVGVKRAGREFEYATPETVVERLDQLIVAGSEEQVQRFCRLD